jgi:HEPN domain-containing protein
MAALSLFTVTMTKINNFKDILNKSLPVIDKYLSSQNEPLSLRPLKATILFIEHFIVEIEGEDKNEFIDSLWFTALSNYTNDWYSNRYGKAIEVDNIELKGIVFVYEHPFELSFPYTLTIDEGNKDTLSLVFLHKFRPEENWMDYFVAGPNIEGLDTISTNNLKQTVIDNIESSRYIFHNFSLIKKGLNETTKISESIQNHISTAVHKIAISSAQEFNLAVWELHLAIEKSLKVILMQIKGCYPRSHDLIKLFNLTELTNQEDIYNLICLFPRHDKVMNLRYGGSGLITVHEIENIYSISLKVIYKISGLLKKELNMLGATAYIKRPKHAGARLVN